MRLMVQPNAYPLPNMNMPMKGFRMSVPRICSRLSQQAGLVLALALGLPGAAIAADTTRTFATPEEAVSALVDATSTHSGADLRALFGPAAAELQNPDRVQATNEFRAFSAALQASHRLVHESGTNCVLELGTNAWPFPVPIVKKDGRWFFDTAAGTEELLNRRIGKNELSVLKSMRGYVAAQREYASRDRNSDEVLEYAQRISSTPGTKDGLYWPIELDGEVSPLGPMVADARSEGYSLKADSRNTPREPVHGYLFKVLTCQGKNAPGGKYSYLINGRMLGGFALVAWPAEYGESGIMTFIVNQQGRVYQKDLGPKTGNLAAAMKVYDPEPGWTVSPD